MIYRPGMKLDKYLAVSCVGIVAALILLGAIVGIKSLFSPEKKQSVNTFVGSYIEVETEEFWGDGIRHIRVRNISDIEAYVRCTPIFTVRDDAGNICDAILQDDDIMNINYDDWVRIGSYYYCRMPVAAGKYSPFFIEGVREKTEDGNTIELKILVSAIDSTDPATVMAQWGIRVNADTTIGELK